jgi:hypothetical protein
MFVFQNYCVILTNGSSFASTFRVRICIQQLENGSIRIRNLEATVSILS